MAAAALANDVARNIPQPFTKEQSEMIEKVRNTDMAVQEYLKEHPLSSFQIVKVNFPTIAAGAGAGGVAAYVVIKITEKIGFAVLSPVSKVISVALGVLLGGVFTAKVVIKDEFSKISLSGNFAEWRAEAMDNEVYPLYQDFIKENEKLEDHLCPITQDLIIYPVRSKDGAIFERQAIEAFLDQCESNEIFDERTHPFRIRRIRKEELEYWPEYHRIVLEQLNEVLTEELIDVARDGLITFRDTITQNNTLALSDMLRVLTNRNIAGLIPREEFETAKTEIISKI